MGGPIGQRHFLAYCSIFNAVHEVNTLGTKEMLLSKFMSILIFHSGERKMITEKFKK